MIELIFEDNFIFEKLKENNDNLNYKQLQILCEDKFEGVRFILKKLKDKGFINYESIIPRVSAEIELIRVF